MRLFQPANSGAVGGVKYASVNSGSSLWRDFVLGRIEEAEWSGEEVQVSRDEEWEVVRLRINQNLSIVKQKALQLDY